VIEALSAALVPELAWKTYNPASVQMEVDAKGEPMTSLTLKRWQALPKSEQVCYFPIEQYPNVMFVRGPTYRRYLDAFLAAPTDYPV